MASKKLRKLPALSNNEAEMIHNAMTQRSDLLRHLMDPRRDINEECGYPTVIGEANYREMYDRELGRRVVSIYPEETWKKLPIIFEDDDPEKETDFEKSLEAVNNKHQLLHYMQRIDELSGVGHYGILLWGIGDGKQLNEAVDGSENWEETTGQESNHKPSEMKLYYIRALDESLVRISTYETDVRNPRYGKPTAYVITLHDPRNQEGGASAEPSKASETTVHWSRVSHIADNRKTSEVIGTPRMEPVWNRLYDLRKVLGGSGEMYWKGGFPGLSLETQPGLENAELDVEATREMMSNYMNGLQRYMATTGMSVKSLAPQISDPTATFDVQIKAICTTLGVPFRVFMGIEEGVVSGDQATKAWDGRLQNRQTRYVTPMIINLVIQRLVDYGVLASPAEPQGWTVEWPDLTAVNEIDRAEVAVKKTDALAKYIGGSVDVLIPPMEYLTTVLGFEDRQAEAMLAAAVEHIDGIDSDETMPGRGNTPEELEGDSEDDDDDDDDDGDKKEKPDFGKDK